LKRYLGAHGHVFAQQVGDGKLGLHAVAVAPRGGRAKAQQAVLVGLGGAQRAVDQDALCARNSLVALTYTSTPLRLGAQEIEHRAQRAGAHPCLCSRPTAICGISVSLSSTASPATRTFTPRMSILMCWPGVTPNGAMPFSAMDGAALKSWRATDSSMRSLKPSAAP
jgi:hypothetical protein